MIDTLNGTRTQVVKENGVIIAQAPASFQFDKTGSYVGQTAITRNYVAPPPPPELEPLPPPPSAEVYVPPAAYGWMGGATEEGGGSHDFAPDELTPYVAGINADAYAEHYGLATPEPEFVPYTGETDAWADSGVSVAAVQEWVDQPKAVYMGWVHDQGFVSSAPGYDNGVLLDTFAVEPDVQPTPWADIQRGLEDPAKLEEIHDTAKIVSEGPKPEIFGWTPPGAEYGESVGGYLIDQVLPGDQDQPSDAVPFFDSGEWDFTPGAGTGLPDLSVDLPNVDIPVAEIGQNILGAAMPLGALALVVLLGNGDD